ncbi:hypothetical protein AAF712_016329 [Marasmius tenuissimus]|uniref:Uncharacterized protein n=1 Tax=Marasmius tenuissimus TaxID=585030 RepID=A0ABR2Z8C8_9AGAR
MTVPTADPNTDAQKAYARFIWTLRSAHEGDPIEGWSFLEPLNFNILFSACSIVTQKEGFRSVYKEVLWDRYPLEMVWRMLSFLSAHELLILSLKDGFIFEKVMNPSHDVDIWQPLRQDMRIPPAPAGMLNHDWFTLIAKLSKAETCDRKILCLNRIVGLRDCTQADPGDSDSDSYDNSDDELAFGFYSEV